MAIEKKLKQRLQNPQQLIYLHSELVRVQSDLQALFRDQLNPFMGSSSAWILERFHLDGD